jgi:hypothetical protein
MLQGPEGTAEGDAMTLDRILIARILFTLTTAGWDVPISTRRR